MSEKLHDDRYQPIRQLLTADKLESNGYEALQKSRLRSGSPQHFDNFELNQSYNAYLKMHKVYVGKKGGAELIGIARSLNESWVPAYLFAGGWAAAEASVVRDDLSTVERIDLMEFAEDSWVRALTNQSALNESREKPWLINEMNEFRIALSLAYAPLIKSIIVGNVTKAIREQVFVDTLAITQTSGVQYRLALNSDRDQDKGAAGSHIGFGHECNALLAFLYNNDPNFVPIPSTFRAGTGYTHKSQTHDLTIINQHWGKIHSIIPTEIKARSRPRDRERYRALLIPGRLYLTLPTSKKNPFITTEAFAAQYEGTATQSQTNLVTQSASTVKDLLTLYCDGDKLEELSHIHTATSFHRKDVLIAKYRELAS